MKKKHAIAPLPFQGQKRMWKNEFIELMKTLPSDCIVVDCFGGSGLLSQFVKEANPDLRVIWNDYDNYNERLEQIDETNEVLAEIRSIVGDHKKNARLSKEMEDEIRQVVLRANERNGRVDYYTISKSLVFSSKSCESLDDFLKSTYYNNVVGKTYSAGDYLNGVERVSCDYMELMDKYQGRDNVIYLLDPPYLSTDTSTYMNTDFSGLAWNIRLLKALQGRKFVLFTSERSEITDLLREIYEDTIMRDAVVRRRTYSVGRNADTKKDNRVEDIMIHNLHAGEPVQTEEKQTNNKPTLWKKVKRLFARG